MSRTALLTMLLAASAAACGRATEPVELEPVHAQAGDTITLGYGQEARIADAVRLIFREVEEDSRCPINVDCVWEGDAAIRIDVAAGGAPWGAVVLHTTGEPKRADIGGYVVELVDVAPARIAPDTVKPADYSIRLAISRG